MKNHGLWVEKRGQNYAIPGVHASWMNALAAYLKEHGFSSRDGGGGVIDVATCSDTGNLRLVIIDIEAHEAEMVQRLLNQWDSPESP